MTNQNHLERFRPSMSGDVLKSWSADAQAEIDRLSKPASTPAIVAAVDALTMAASFISDLNSAHGNTEGQGVREACGKALAGLVELLPGMKIAPCRLPLTFGPVSFEVKPAKNKDDTEASVPIKPSAKLHLRLGPNGCFQLRPITPCRCGPDGCSDSACPGRQYKAADLRMMAESLVSLAKASPGVEIPVIDGDTPPHKILAAAQAVAVKWGLADRYVSFYTPAGASVLVTAQV